MWCPCHSRNPHIFSEKKCKVFSLLLIAKRWVKFNFRAIMAQGVKTNGGNANKGSNFPFVLIFAERSLLWFSLLVRSQSKPPARTVCDVKRHRYKRIIANALTWVGSPSNTVVDSGLLRLRGECASVQVFPILSGKETISLTPHGRRRDISSSTWVFEGGSVQFYENITVGIFVWSLVSIES